MTLLEAARLLVETTTCPACHSKDGKDCAKSWFHSSIDVDCNHPFHAVFRVVQSEKK